MLLVASCIDPVSEDDNESESVRNQRRVKGGIPRRMGAHEDEEACVDSDFRVRGLHGLRVVDLSVLPFLLNCHPVSIAYLVGEIAAEKIAADYYS